MPDPKPPIDALPPDQRAVLSLILRRGKSYADIAEALELDEGAVRERAQGALVALAPDLAGAVADSEREQIGDYLLGQQGAAQRLVTYDAIEGSDGARAYAAALSGALADVSGGALPAVPPTSPAVSPSGVPSPAPRRPREQEPTAARRPRQSAPVRAAAAQGSGARAAPATSRDRPSASNRHLRQASRGSRSTTSISISSTPLSPSNLETFKTRGTRTAM